MRVYIVPGFDAKQGLALSLSQVRLCLHGYEQGGGSSTAARQVRQHRGGGFPKVHPQSALRGRTVSALGQADSLSLLAVPIRGVGSGADVGAQVPTHGHLTISRKSPARGRMLE